MENKKKQTDETEEREIVPEEFATDREGDGDTAENALQKCKKKLTACEKDRQEYLDGWQRSKADFVNARREEEEARKKVFAAAQEETLLSIVPVADSFELAFANKEAWAAVPEGWRKGVEYIHVQLLKALQDNGLTEVAPLGEPFDPARHESVGSAPVSKKEEHDTVMEVLAKGYALNGKIVRPPRVTIGLYVQKDE